MLACRGDSSTRGDLLPLPCRRQPASDAAGRSRTPSCSGCPRGRWPSASGGAKGFPGARSPSETEGQGRSACPTGLRGHANAGTLDHTCCRPTVSHGQDHPCPHRRDHVQSVSRPFLRPRPGPLAPGDKKRTETGSAGHQPVVPGTQQGKAGHCSHGYGSWSPWPSWNPAGRKRGEERRHE